MGKYNKRNPTIAEKPYKVGDMVIRLTATDKPIYIIIQVKKVARQIGGADFAYFEYKLRKISTLTPEFTYVDHFTMERFYEISSWKQKTK